MGLSPGKATKKVNAQEDAARTAINNVNTVNPLEQRISDKATKFFNWEDDTTKPKNILEAPGISDYMDIYGSAENVAGQEMKGNGLGLASPSNGAYHDQIVEQGKNQRYNDRARGLSDALGGLKAQNYGMADQVINNDMQRKQAYAGLQQGQLSQYYNRYKIQNPWYQKLFNASLKAAPVVAGALA